MAAITPMDVVPRADPASIPLKCNLCPKKPNFSDVSHLLTHISSKSHLSHRFKTELRSHTERAAQEAMRQYNDWYENYGIRGLLADRMAAKDQKKTGKRGRALISSASEDLISSYGDLKIDTHLQGKARPASSGQNNLVKVEPADLLQSPAETTASGWPVHMGLPHQGVPHTMMHPEFRPPDLRFGYVDIEGWRTNQVHSSSSGNYSLPGTPDTGPDDRYMGWLSPSTDETPLPIEDDEGEVDEAAKLKGVRYPGMGLFDAASEVAKKKRNQRKDDSVLKKMELTSEGIEPFEFVWTEDGELARVRDIYSCPSIEGSPDRKLEDDEEDEPPRKKRTRRQAPSNPTVNKRSTRTSSRIAKKAATRQMDDEEDDFSLDLVDDTGPASSHVQGAGDGYDVFQDRPKQRLDGTGSPADGESLDSRRRSALQPMNHNHSLMSEPAIAVKQHQYLPSRADGSAFPSHPAISSNPYFPQQVGLGNGTYNTNPLYVQTRNGYFHPYSYSSYGPEVKASTPNFPSMANTVNPNLTGLQFGSFQTSYPAESPHQNGQTDFGL